MCGLFGHTDPYGVSLETSRRALHTLSHRGPDQWGEWIDNSVFIGHRRLSILDLSDRGRQPMSDDEAGIVIAVNGEIYNFKSLREQLSPTFTFRSNSDSEVVLYGYQAWGLEGLLERMDGMFAVVIYDRRERKVCLARDRAGIKPLYYAIRDGVLAWASELKALVSAFSQVSLIVDVTALYDFLTYRYIPAPKSLYESVYKLEASHYLEWRMDRQTPRIARYWTLDVGDRNIAPRQAADRLRNLIRDSVQQQMVSDVPVGFFLSGGIDSSVVVSEACEVSDRIHTYAIGFDDPKHDETEFANVLADHCGTDHQVKVLDRDSVDDQYAQLRTWYDEPFGDSSAFPTYLVSKFAREGVTVALTGDGGDEVFGGYLWYASFVRSQNRRLACPALFHSAVKLGKRLPGRLAGQIARQLEYRCPLPPLELYTKLMGGLLADEKQTYRQHWEISPDYDDYWYFRKYYREDMAPLTRLQWLDFHTFLPEDILTKVDRASMAVSLEARVPLLSRELIEFSFSVPQQVRLPAGRLKGLMKDAYHGILPAKILNRGKKGFSIPTRAWRLTLKDRNYSLQETILHRLFAREAGFE